MGCFYLVTKDRHTHTHTTPRLQPAPLSQPSCSPSMAARAKGAAEMLGTPRGSSRVLQHLPFPPALPGSGCWLGACSPPPPRLGTPPPAACVWLPWVGLARHPLDGTTGPAQATRRSVSTILMRHCGTAATHGDVTAEILPVCRPASAASARLRRLPVRRQCSLHGGRHRCPSLPSTPTSPMPGCIPLARRRACAARVQRDKPPFIGTRPRACPKTSVPWGGGP